MGLLADYLPSLPADPAQNDAARQGLLAFGAAMLGGRGNFGQILGQGLASGAGGYNSALQALQQKALHDAQTKHYTLENDATQAKIDEPGKIASILGQGGAPSLSGGGVAPVALVTGGAAPLSSLPQMTPAADRPLSMIPQASAPGQVATPPADAAPAAAPVDDYAFYKARGDALANAGHMAAAKTQYDLADKARPKVKDVMTLVQNGKRVKVQTFDDGRKPQVLEGFDPDMEKLVGYGAGGTYNFADPFSGKTISSAPITQSADSKASTATQIQVQNMINARQAAADAGEPDAKLTSEELRMMAEQGLAGDKSVFQNLGRGKQGAENIVLLRREMTRQAKALGWSGADIAAATADFEGLKAGLRTSSNISARVENAISEAKELAPLAIEASKKVARSGFLPFGKAQIMFDTNTNDPDLKSFVTANNGLVSAYAGAMARGQKPTQSDYEHARHILAEGQSQAAYEATVNQMYKEMAAASRAPQNVREHLRGEIGGKGKSAVKDVKDLPKNPPAPVAFSDAEKERRYQEWKRSHSK